MTEFEALYQTYFRDVFLYIRRLSGDEHIAEEVTSEAFFKAMGSLDTFRGACDIRVWLCQIAKNCYLSHQRKAGRMQSMEELAFHTLPDPDEPMEEKLTRQEVAMELRKLLHGIPEPYREVFMWRVFGELSFRQIAQIFGKSENWACVTYHRARSKIREKWEEENHDQ